MTTNSWITRSMWISLLVIVLIATGSATARDYQFSQLRMNVVVNLDGSLDVHEQRTAVFDGVYTGMYQNIPIRDKMQISNVTVSEGGEMYTKLNQTQPGPAGTYFVKYSTNEVLIDWSFYASNQQRTFDVMYTVENVVLVHDDVAELYYQFIGPEWERGVDHVEINVFLPKPTNLDDLRAWGHGPLHGTVEIVDQQHVKWEISSLPAKTMLEGRVVFAKEVIPDADTFTNRTALADILAEEEQNAARANRRRMLMRFDWYAGVLLLVGALVVAIHSWSTYGKEFKPEFEGEYYRELPTDYTPAELGVLWSAGSVVVKDFTATLLDLARRKYIKIEEVVSDKKGIFRKKSKTDYYLSLIEQEDGEQNKLKSHEQYLVDFIFKTVKQEGDNTVGFEQIETYAKKHKSSFSSFWSSWQQKVKKEAEAHRFFDTSGKKRRIILVISSIAGLVLAFVAFANSLPGTGLGLLVAAFVLFVGGLVLKRRSQTGSTQFAKWKAFKRFLEHFSEIKRQEIPALVIWEHFLVYAVTLGVAEKVIDQLQMIYPNLEDGDYRFGYGWYYYAGVASAANLQNSFNNLTTSMQNSFQQSVRSATHTSSGSGSGGGFSSGGGGGFGGGGGGAR